MTSLRRLLVLILVLLCTASGLGAQEEDPVRFDVISETGEAVIVVGSLLDDRRLLEAIHSGLPLRIRILVQLWKDGLFDDVHGRFEWRASVVFDPLTRRYRIQTGAEEGVIHEVNTLEEARSTLQLTLDLPIRPRERGRYYYEADVEMETLSLSDLEELQRWLQGELGPAVTGEEDVEGAMARGFRRLLVRMLGLPTRRFQVRSHTIPVGEGGVLSLLDTRDRQEGGRAQPLQHPFGALSPRPADAPEGRAGL